MSDAGFDRLRELLLELAELPPEAREIHLARACPDDPELRRTALELVAMDLGPDALDPLPGREAEPADDPVGVPERLGPYEIRGRLGTGGMGVVYLGRDPSLERDVAIKVLPGHLSASPDALARFRREARLLARLSHPNIATVHSLESDGDRLLITMEHVRGRSLAARLGEGAIPSDDVLEIAGQLARALEAAHAEGVIHRDLKPGNVMLGENGTVTVLDFGIADLVSETGDADATGGRGEVLGTPGYMSPEQIRGEALDGRADLWAFGCVIYECLTGHKAFGGDTTTRVKATLEADVALEEIPAATPDGLRDLVAGCLQRSRSARVDSAETARRRVDEVLEARAFARVAAKLEGERAVSSVPVYPTRFFGREAERRKLRALLESGRVVTITGLGGTGKTRLAAELARELASEESGVCFVPLVALDDEHLLARTVATAIGVPETRAASDLDAVTDFLRERRLLLVLDNCEHVADAAADLVTAVSTRCRHVRVLATSREALRVDGEHVIPIQPLPLPEADATGQANARGVAPASDVVRLFVDRAVAADASFELNPSNVADVVALCRAAEGVPLAVELAAAYCNVLTPSEILERFGERVHVLEATRRAGDPRHHSLRAMLDWSHDQLGETERVVLRRLSVFRGGFTLDAAEAVCSGGEVASWKILDAISSLVGASLVDRDPRGRERATRSRYRMLELVREYAAMRLSHASEEGETRGKLLGHFRALFGPLKLTGAEQQLWLARYLDEAENVREALRHARADETRAGDAAELAIRLVGPWIRTGRWREGRAALEALTGWATIRDLDPRLHVRLLRGLAEVATYQGDLADASRYLRDAQETAEPGGDPTLLLDIMSMRSTVERQRGNFTRARELLDRSLALRREHPNDWDYSGLLFNRGVTFALQGMLDEAEADFEASLEIKRRLDDARGVSHALNGLGHIKINKGAYDEARTLLEESLETKRSLGDEPGVVTTLLNLGLASLSEFSGRPEDAEALERPRACYEEALERVESLGDRPNRPRCLDGLAWCALLAGDTSRARAVFSDALAATRELGDRGFEAWVLAGLGFLALAERRFDDAHELATEALERFLDTGITDSTESVEILAQAALGRGDAAEAARLLAAAERQREAGVAAIARWKARQLARCREDVAATLDPRALRAASEEGRALDPRQIWERARADGGR